MTYANLLKYWIYQSSKIKLVSVSYFRCLSSTFYIPFSHNIQSTHLHTPTAHIRPTTLMTLVDTSRWWHLWANYVIYMSDYFFVFNIVHTLEGKFLKKASFYIAQYPVLLTIQSALYFTSLTDLFSQTPSRLLWEAFSHVQQLMREGRSHTYPSLSIARYSFIQLSELEQCRVKKLAAA